MRVAEGEEGEEREEGEEGEEGEGHQRGETINTSGVSAKPSVTYRRHVDTLVKVCRDENLSWLQAIARQSFKELGDVLHLGSGRGRAPAISEGGCWVATVRWQWRLQGEQHAARGKRGTREARQPAHARRDS